MSVIYRYEVPVDDQWHDMRHCGDIVHVTTRSANVVEVWAVHTSDNANERARSFRVYGTGQPFPDDLRYVGTALAGPFVWHLMERDGS